MAGWFEMCGCRCSFGRASWIRQAGFSRRVGTIPLSQECTIQIGQEPNGRSGTKFALDTHLEVLAVLEMAASVMFIDIQGL